jgi:hypothetical protein
MTVIVAASALPLLRGPLDIRDSVSRTWSGSRRRWLTLAMVMSVAGTGMCASMGFWLVPYYDLPALTYAVIALAYVAFMGVAWVPMLERPGDHSYLHKHFLGGAALATLAIVAMAIIVFSGKDVPRAAWMACLVSMILAAGWPLPFTRRLRGVFLLIEALIALSFAAAVILLYAGR